MVPDWQEQARCRGVDTDLFFPADGANPNEARWFCRRCPVTRQCLDAAMRGDEQHGVWGGHLTQPADHPPAPARRERAGGVVTVWTADRAEAYADETKDGQ